MPCATGHAQTATKTDAADADKRRVTFERNLFPDSPVLGEPGWPLTDRMRRYAVPGLQVAVLTGGELATVKGYGLADPKTQRSVTPNTLFDPGSISKAVTALAVVKLADEGRFTLDTPVNSLLRTWKLPENEFTRKTPVTLRHLLTHTAGTTVRGMWGYLEKDPKPTVLQILDGLPPATNGAVRVTAEPGKAWSYSGGGYVVLQQMLEDVQNKPFTEIMQETVFKPLCMTRSSFVQGLPPSLRDDVAEPTSEAPYFTGETVQPADGCRWSLHHCPRSCPPDGSGLSFLSRRTGCVPVARDGATNDRADYH
jgi:CubicO group peptidase (beta-lactamase class C family)